MNKCNFFIQHIQYILHGYLADIANGVLFYLSLFHHEFLFSSIVFDSKYQYILIFLSNL